MTPPDPSAADPRSRAPRHRIVQVRPLTEHVFELVISRAGLPMLPGQHVTLGVENSSVNREYSVYAITPDTLSFLVKVRPDSVVSRELQASRPGTGLALAGPFGAFTIAESENPAREYSFIATGVGIAPFHAFATGFPRLRYRLLHGVHRLTDRYDRADYAPGAYMACVSREPGGEFHGRVTDYLAGRPTDTGRLYYLCGSGVMVSEVYDLLRQRGVPSDQLKTEVFF